MTAQTTTYTAKVHDRGNGTAYIEMVPADPKFARACLMRDDNLPLAEAIARAELYNREPERFWSETLSA